MLGLASPKEALGLPDGSIRAVIALMLLVLFTIVAIFLYNRVANGVESVDGITASQLTELRKQVPVVLTVPDTGDGPFKVYFRNMNPAGDDIAKQLITLLGTLVTAIASFYFGANAVSSALEPPSGPPVVPKLTGVSPNPIPSDGNATPLTVSGNNLGKISAVTLERAGESKITATNVHAQSDGKVTLDVAVPPGTKTGDWEVVVSDGTNQAKFSVKIA